MSMHDRRTHQIVPRGQPGEVIESVAGLPLLDQHMVYEYLLSPGIQQPVGEPCNTAREGTRRGYSKNVIIGSIVAGDTTLETLLDPELFDQSRDVWRSRAKELGGRIATPEENSLYAADLLQKCATGSASKTDLAVIEIYKNVFVKDSGRGIIIHDDKIFDFCFVDIGSPISGVLIVRESGNNQATENR